MGGGCNKNSAKSCYQANHILLPLLQELGQGFWRSQSSKYRPLARASVSCGLLHVPEGKEFSIVISCKFSEDSIYSRMCESLPSSKTPMSWTRKMYSAPLGTQNSAQRTAKASKADTHLPREAPIGLNWEEILHIKIIKTLAQTSLPSSLLTPIR